jgi:hypothetical protein
MLGVNDTCRALGGIEHEHRIDGGDHHSCTRLDRRDRVHEPHLSRLAAALLHSDGTVRIALPKSGVIDLECAAKPARAKQDTTRWPVTGRTHTRVFFAWILPRDHRYDDQSLPK